MSKFHQLLLIIIGISLWSVHLLTSNSWILLAERNYYDITSEFFNIIFILFLLTLNIKISNQKAPQNAFYWGLICLFIGHVHDLLDEFINIVPMIISLFLENGATNLGSIIIIFALYNWSKEYRDQVKLLTHQQKALTSASNTDAMTGLYNRRYLNTEFLKRQMNCSKFQQTWSLILIDLDNFKKFNDNYGHLEGDKLIKKAAEVIKTETRETDYCFRYGGEEFLVVIKGNNELAIKVAERIRLTYQNLDYQVNNQVISTTLSAGINQLQPDTEFESALDLADQGLYQAKHLGRNCIIEMHKDPSTAQAISTAVSDNQLPAL